jgi:hypothetical protein
MNTSTRTVDRRAIISPSSIRNAWWYNSAPLPEIGPREFFALRGWMVTENELRHLESIRVALKTGRYSDDVSPTDCSPSVQG